MTIEPTLIPLDEDVPYAVYCFGHAMAEHITDKNMAITTELADDGFYGACLLGTAVLVSEDEPLEHKVVNMRTVMAVDIHGIAYDVTRIEGQDLSIHDNSEYPLEADIAHEGLRLLCLAITRHMNNNTDYVQALMDLNLHIDGLPTCGASVHRHDSKH